MVIPLKESSNPNYLFEAYQSGDVTPPNYGGTGASTLAQFLTNNNIVSATLTSITTGQALIWNGSKFVNSSIPTGGPGATALSSLTDVTITTPTTSHILTWNGTSWVPSAAPGAGGGEANTASNLGGGPGSSFSGKVGVDLQFRTLSGVNVVITNVGNIIQVSAQTSTALTNSNQVDHGSVVGLADNDHPQYVLSSTNNNLSSTVSNHIANTSNPHNTTAAQVGNTTAQWNASAIKGFSVDLDVPSDGHCLGVSGSEIRQFAVVKRINGEFGDIVVQNGPGVDFTNTATSNFQVSARHTSSIWNASALEGYDLEINSTSDRNFLQFSSNKVVAGPIWHIRTTQSDLTMLNTSTYQPIFNSPSGYNVEAGFMYEFKLFSRHSKSGNVTTNFIFSSTNGAVLSAMRYFSISQNHVDNTQGTAQTTNFGVTSGPVLVGAAGTNRCTIILDGVFYCTTSGTIIPGFSFSGAPGVPTLYAGSYIQFRKLGPNDQNIIVGDFV